MVVGLGQRDDFPNRTMAESLGLRVDSKITTFRVAGDDAAEWCQIILPQVLLSWRVFAVSTIDSS